MHVYLTEQPPQASALLQGEPPSWLPSQDEDGSLSSPNAEEQHYVPEKKGRNLACTNLSLCLFGEISSAQGLSLLCDHTRCYTMKPALNWNPSQLQSKYK